MAKKHINVHNTFYPGVNNLRNKQKPSKNRISRPDIRGYPANLAGFRDKYRTSKIPDFCKLTKQEKCHRLASKVTKYLIMVIL